MLFYVQGQLLEYFRNKEGIAESLDGKISVIIEVYFRGEPIIRAEIVNTNKGCENFQGRGGGQWRVPVHRHKLPSVRRQKHAGIVCFQKGGDVIFGIGKCGDGEKECEKKAEEPKNGSAEEPKSGSAEERKSRRAEEPKSGRSESPVGAKYRSD
jgi:hypothetical protein